MVQDYVSPIRVHKFSFEMVMAAYERRFPACPQIPVVVDCAITDDSWSADSSQRHTTRKCQLNVDAPYLMKKMVGVDYIYFNQKNHLDLAARVLLIEATNETFASKVVVIEKCKYYVHPENSDWTCFEQSAQLDVKSFFGLESTVEKIAMKQYAANIAKGKELIEVFMADLMAEGVTSLQPWRAGEGRRNRELRRILSRGTEPLSPPPVVPALPVAPPTPPGPSRIDSHPSVTSKRSSLATLIRKRFKTRLKRHVGTSVSPANLPKVPRKTKVARFLKKRSKGSDKSIKSVKSDKSKAKLVAVIREAPPSPPPPPRWYDSGLVYLALLVAGVMVMLSLIINNAAYWMFRTDR